MNILKSGLRTFLRTHNASFPNYHDSENEAERQHFIKMYTIWKGNKCQNLIPSSRNVPRFYNSVAYQNKDTLPVKLKEDARCLFLQNQGQSELNDSELRTFCCKLELKLNSSDGCENRYLNYVELKELLSETSDKPSHFFTPLSYSQLLQGESTFDFKIKISKVFQYAVKKSWMRQMRVDISLYDTVGLGYLKESELELYISKLIPTLPQLRDLDESFISLYLVTAVKKFMFFLDPMRIGKIKIQHILMSGFLDDLMELKDEEWANNEELLTNWFSVLSTFRILRQYVKLDSDHNGMLNKDELSKLGGGVLTNAFIDRVFDECPTYNREIEYKAYVELILALENRAEPQALHFFFRILDVNGKGYLDSHSLNHFFKATDNEVVQFEDFLCHIFYMINPVDPTKITFLDVLKSGQGDVLVNILIDLNGFYAIENNEFESETK